MHLIVEICSTNILDSRLTYILISLQYSMPPNGTERLRFRLEYTDTKSGDTTYYYTYSYSEDDIQTVTLSGLAPNTTYTVCVMAQIRYEHCYGYLYGECSEYFNFTTVATRMYYNTFT